MTKLTKNYIFGVSLVELLVSVTISLILMLGIINVYVGSKETYQVREDFGILQELGRQVLETITGSVQMADHWGGIPSDTVSVGTVATLTGNGACDSNWILNASQPIFGEDGTAFQSGISLSNCIGAGTYVSNSDVLVLRYAEGDAIPDATVNSASVSPEPPNIYLRSEVEVGAVLVTNAVGATSSTGISSSNAARNHEYKVEAYFLRNCSDTGCTDGIPSLARLTMIGDQLQTEVLADGVEQIQFLYGVDTNNDTVADQFLNAGNVTNWDLVTTVSIDMIIRSPTQDLTISDTATYNLAGGAAAAGGINFTPSTATQAYHRKQLNKLIHVRNRVRT